MADVFLSYKSEHRHVTERIAHLLRLYEMSVWWDDALTGERADPEIRSQIAAAKAVVILISKAALRSDWVLGEADRAGDKIVPAKIESINKSELPTPLLGHDIIDLTDWDGTSFDKEFPKLIARCLQLRSGTKPHGVSPLPTSMEPSPIGASKVRPPETASFILSGQIQAQEIIIGNGGTINKTILEKK